MSRVSLKTDYIDGQILYGDDLNTNNKVIQLGVNDNQDQIDKLSRDKANSTDIIELKEQVANKADKDYVDEELDKKVDGAYVDNQLALKADKSELNNKADKSEVAAKADTSYVNAQLATKANTSDLANKADIDDLATKADRSYVDTQLKTKADVSALTSKADTSYVDQQLANKANTSDLANKTDRSYVDNQLALKADKSSLAAKADTSYVNEQLATKANTSYVDLQLETKADVSALTSKADTSYVDEQLETKTDKTYVDNQLALKADKSSLAAKVDKTYVDSQLATKADTTYVNEQLETKADKSTIGDLSSLQTSSKDNLVNAINEAASSKQIPIASSNTLGGIKVGANLEIEEDGTLNATGGGTGGGTSDYNELSNIPTINGIKIKGTLVSDDLNLVSKEDLNTELATKADTSYVDQQLATKANTSYVDSQLETKADISSLLDKADTAYVNEQLTVKADKTYVNSQLETKADKSSLAAKVNKTYVDSQLANKADTSYVDSQLEAKADVSALTLKADTSYVDEQLETKANTTSVNEQLATKADKSALAAKVDKTYVNTQLGNKADTSYVNTQLGNKADTSYVNTQLDKKQNKLTPGSNITIVDNTISAIVDLSNYYNKTTSDSRYLAKNVVNLQAGSNLDTIKTPGFYFFAKEVANNPKSTKNGYLFVLPKSGDYAAQLVISEDNDGFFYRVTLFSSSSSGPAWTPWVNSSTSKLIGVLEDLKTNNKSDLVSALNEVYDMASYYVVINKNQNIDLNDYVDNKRYDIGRNNAYTVTNGPFGNDKYEGKGIILDVYSVKESGGESSATLKLYQVLNTTTLSNEYEKMYRTATVNEELNVLNEVVKSSVSGFSEWKPLVYKSSNFGDSMPIGATIEWFGTDIPSNFLELNGQEISRTTYKELFDIVGTVFGSGNGTTTFNLPNKKGRMSIGLNPDDTDFNTLGKKGGSKTHLMTINELVNHTHPIAYGGSQTGESEAVVGSNGVVNPNNRTIIKAEGQNQPFNIMNPYIVSKFIVKAKNSTGYVKQGANVIANLDSSSDTDALSASMGKELKSRNPNRIFFNRLSDIGLSSFTTLDEIVEQVPVDCTFQVYVSKEDATKMYNQVGGAGNLPTPLDGLLTVQKLNSNQYVYIQYQTTETICTPENKGQVGTYTTFKKDSYTSWTNNIKASITAYPNYVVIGAVSYQIFELRNVKAQSGDTTKLSLENGKVKIGKDVHHVTVSAQCCDSTDARTGRAIYIYKNSEKIARSLINMGTNFQESLHISPYVVEVQEGDYLGIYVEGSGIKFSGGSDLTWLTVEEKD
nr:MAG TPA: tail collar domain [Caudoviricetes sp.]